MQTNKNKGNTNNRRGRAGSLDSILKALHQKGVSPAPATLHARASITRTAKILEVEGETVTISRDPMELKTYTLEYTDSKGKATSKDVTDEVNKLFEAVTPVTAETEASEA